MFLISRSPATQEGDADGWLGGGGERETKRETHLAHPLQLKVVRSSHRC